MHNIYIASCAGDGGVLHCRLSPDGKLSIVQKIALDRPMYIIRENSKLHVLLRAPFSHNENSGICEISLGPDGEMGLPTKPQDTLGLVSAHMCLVNGKTYTANYISGSISMLPDTQIFHADFCPGKASHPHFISPTPDGEYLAVADLGLDELLLYDFNLSLVQRVKLPDGSGCRHLAFSPDGHYAYCANELSSTVSILSYVPGRLELIGTADLLPVDFEGFNAPAAIRCTEEWVYVSNRGYDRISKLSRCGEKLKLVDQIDCGGHWPRDFWCLSPYIICANEKSDMVTVLRDGKAVSILDISCPVCVLSD